MNEDHHRDAAVPARSPNEGIKQNSEGLRGTLAHALPDELTGALSDDDGILVKFHGMYLQDDRDERAGRMRRRLDKAYAFMIRLRLPGGVCSPAQWQTLNAIADAYGNGTMRLTTRQTFQFHGIIKHNLKATLKTIDGALLDTLAACGDVNRTVMAAPDPERSALHKAAYELAKRLSDAFLPQTGAYREIWLDGEKIIHTPDPLYGETYLPRKFKIGIAVPPYNDVDVFTQDLGFVALSEAGGKKGAALKGWNVLVGGGMGTTHGDSETHPRLGSVLGACAPDAALAFARAVITVQRDYGNRTVRKLARTKYTIDRLGAPAFKQLVEERAGLALMPPQEVAFLHNRDRYETVKGDDGRLYKTLFVENGRLTAPMRAAMVRALPHVEEIRLTPNQNLTLVCRTAKDLALAEAALAEDFPAASRLRAAAMACVALPTCSLALAESERYLPTLITKLEGLLAAHGLEDKPITVRMTGCPNGCARPFVAEIGFVGRALGRYDMHLGGDASGARLARLYRQNLSEEEILALLAPLFERYARAGAKPSFGDFALEHAVF